MGNLEEEILMPCSGSRAQQEEESLLFSGKDSASEKHWIRFFVATHHHSPLYKTALFPLLSGNLQVVHDDSRAQTVILC